MPFRSVTMRILLSGRELELTYELENETVAEGLEKCRLTLEGYLRLLAAGQLPFGGKIKPPETATEATWQIKLKPHSIGQENPGLVRFTTE